jgi:hypothetical protein
MASDSSLTSTSASVPAPSSDLSVAAGNPLANSLLLSGADGSVNSSSVQLVNPYAQQFHPLMSLAASMGLNPASVFGTLQTQLAVAALNANSAVNSAAGSAGGASALQSLSGSSGNNNNASGPNSSRLSDPRMRVHFQICSQCNMYAVRYPFTRQVRDQFVRDCQAVATKGGSAADLEAARNPIPNFYSDCLCLKPTPSHQRKYRGHRKTLLARTQLLQQASIVTTTPTAVTSTNSIPASTATLSGNAISAAAVAAAALSSSVSGAGAPNAGNAGMSLGQLGSPFGLSSRMLLSDGHLGRLTFNLDDFFFSLWTFFLLLHR